MENPITEETESQDRDSRSRQRREERTLTKTAGMDPRSQKKTERTEEPNKEQHRETKSKEPSE